MTSIDLLGFGIEESRGIGVSLLITSLAMASSSLNAFDVAAMVMRLIPPISGTLRGMSLINRVGQPSWRLRLELSLEAKCDVNFITLAMRASVATHQIYT